MFAGLVVRKVAAVPSGSIKLNGSPGLLLPAIWNRSVVFAGTVAVHDSVFQRPTEGGVGLESFAPDTIPPEAAKVVCCIMVRKLKSRVESAAHVPPLLAVVTR